MALANRPLNSQAIILEEAETQIRLVVKNEFFKNTSKTAIEKRVFAIIRAATAQITIDSLRNAAVRSLLQFYNRQYEELRRSFGWQFFLFSAVMLLNGKTPTGAQIKPTAAKTEQAIQTLEQAGFNPPRVLGVPLQRFTNDYMRDYVRPALERLAKQKPLDPDDITGRATLRLKAEMEVRYAYQQDQLNTFKQNGVRLVICSTHADCSERCAPWQGKVYSLDGTYGTTDDGRSYQPLENATDIYYTTKAGKTYKNGLLGFNCRHFLVAYKSGYRFPKPNAEQERREYAITEEQRRLETQVRKWRTFAAEYKGQDPQKYKEARQKAIAWNNAYIAFSKQNNRPYYPSRTQII